MTHGDPWRRADVTAAPGDNDPHRFWWHVACAVQRALAALCLRDQHDPQAFARGFADSNRYR